MCADSGSCSRVSLKIGGPEGSAGARRLIAPSGDGRASTRSTRTSSGRIGSGWQGRGRRGLDDGERHRHDGLERGRARVAGAALGRRGHRRQPAQGWAAPPPVAVGRSGGRGGLHRARHPPSACQRERLGEPLPRGARRRHGDDLRPLRDGALARSAGPPDSGSHAAREGARVLVQGGRWEAGGAVPRGLSEANGGRGGEGKGGQTREIEGK
jgi:hypothetical protein